MTFERILVAHDLTETSDEAFRLGIELARKSNAALTILHVYAVPVTPMPEGYVFHGGAALAKLHETVQLALERLEKSATARGVTTVRTDSRAGAAGEAILEEARAGGYDLLVLGTHGRKGVARMLLGSVAEAVLRRAPCPVLTVHPGPAEVEMPLRPAPP